MAIALDDIIQAIQFQQVRITDHADEEADDDQLTLDDIYHSVFCGEVLEAYPEERPYPRCLIYGSTRAGYPVHSVWAYNRQTRWAVLVTVYRPDPNRWTNWRTRK